ncbi:hypothetical protein B0T24DRAFT_702497 [Lasiosphaeria ovina]|uniref:Uncharacterized protein n=1 Tax=Lasiosphaeria ovina TaxID=92902 RepID=A0AAE0KBS1_9PEZI|nr:hypothetical protein B0T24DRAFT_702497 [Lasiosphaeria ovina]
MATFTVTDIFRVHGDANNYNIRQGFGPAHANTVVNDAIFDRTEPVPGPVDQGQHPVAFRFDANHIPLTVRGTCDFPVAAANYRLRCTGPGNFQITSQSFNSGPGGANVVFTATVFSNGALNPLSPFKVAGNWQWTMLRAADNSTLAIAPTTRLEIYFLLGPHSHPGIFATTFFLELLRLSAPDYVTLAGLAAGALEARIIHDIATRLWNTGVNGTPLYYDCRRGYGGASQHILNGTEFNLETVITKPPHRCTCNCYDLACLVKLTVDSLGQRPGGGAFVAGVAVTYDRPFGYVPPGPLFGWQNSPAHINCNNPFWQNAGVGGADDPWNMAKDDARRQPFLSHCYTVFTNTAGQQRVIDICHGNLNPVTNAVTLSDGVSDVQGYRATALDTPASNVFTITALRV